MFKRKSANEPTFSDENELHTDLTADGVNMRTLIHALALGCRLSFLERGEIARTVTYVTLLVERKLDTAAG